MNWQFWKSPPKKPSLLIEIDSNKDLQIKVDWDKPKTEQEALELANDLAATVILLTNGHITELLLGAISSAGEKNGCRELAAAVIKLTNEVGPNYAIRPNDGVVVPKSHQVFQTNYFVDSEDDNDEDYR